MIQGKTAILAYFDSIKQPYYAIFYKGQVDKGNSIFRNDKDTERTIDYTDARMNFENNLGLLQYGDYTIVISDKHNVTTRGGNRVDFKIGLQEAAPATATPVVAGIGAISMEDVERKANEIADKRFKELMDKKDLQDTKAKLVEAEKEIKELEKKTNDPLNRLLEAAAPHSDAIISGLFGTKKTQAQVVLSGTEADAVGEADEQSQATIENFIGALAEAKPNEWQSILVKLTSLIKNDPSKFEMALKFI
jgi:hypothetical protein